jgi:hypothetical protein
MVGDRAARRKAVWARLVHGPVSGAAGTATGPAHGRVWAVAARDSKMGEIGLFGEFPEAGRPADSVPATSRRGTQHAPGGIASLFAPPPDTDDDEASEARQGDRQQGKLPVPQQFPDGRTRCRQPDLELLCLGRYPPIEHWEIVPRPVGPGTGRGESPGQAIRSTHCAGRAGAAPRARYRAARASVSGADGAGRGDVVLEVGPGFGSLTLGLLATAGRVVAVEVDPVLACAR